MARVGFEYIVAGELDETVSKSKATVKYKNAREIGPGANVNGTPTSADAKDYGDDRTVATDTSVSGGTLSLELNEPTMENEAWMLGHKMTEEGGMLRNTNDVAPFLGVGFVGKSKNEANKLIYKAKAYLKSQFKVPGDSNATKQENVTFNHTTMEGSIYQLENGDWQWEKAFDTLDTAKAALNTLFGIGEGA